MATLSSIEAATLRDIIDSNEDGLTDRVLFYAQRQGYTRYSSTLREAWRLSIHGLSASLLSALDEGSQDMELTPEETFAVNPLTRFGITEAIRHRKRGISLEMFLGLFKYYRQSYLELIAQHLSDQALCRTLSHALTRFFDHIEISLCKAWMAATEGDRVVELQQANRAMTNEKNKYLTIFESLHSPVAVLNRENKIAISNHAWKVLFGEFAASGKNDDSDRHHSPATWLTLEIERFIGSQQDEAILEKAVSTDHGQRHYFIRIKRMLDVSEKFSGCVIILDDVTSQKQAEAATCNSERLHGALELAGAVCHDLNQPLMAISGYAELLLMDCPQNAPQSSKLKKIINQVNKLGDITKKLMHVTRYETKTYMDKQIIDIEKASGGA